MLIRTASRRRAAIDDERLDLQLQRLMPFATVDKSPPLSERDESPMSARARSLPSSTC